MALKEELGAMDYNEACDTSSLDSIGAKFEVIKDKKLSKFKLDQGSANVSSTNEKPFSCSICGGSNSNMWR